uniref:RES family NAD+ phosphorylase n=1 Tax=Herbidospora sakaeratensis TaxID=564415 RepID=UPI00078498CA|nr:RES family NAD+ phosphorylase [Herbidospora sakaeratensis]
MPKALPGECGGVPRREIVPAGTIVWRLHRRHRDPAAFNDTVAESPLSGGRFSGTPDYRYPVLYMAFSEETAMAESLLRSLPFENSRKRVVPRAAVKERRLSALEITQPLTLLRLVSSPDLAGVCQDEWLVHCDPADYDVTRRWAHWLHGGNPWAQGLVWSSRRNLGEKALVLFGDRCKAPLKPVDAAGYDLDDLPGTLWLNDRLAAFGAAVALPTA